MDPQDQFKSRYNAFVEGRKQQLQKVVPPPQQKRSPFNKFYALGIIAGIIIILPITFLFLRQNTYKDTGSVAGDPTVVSEQALDLQLREIWGKYYNQAKNDPKLREAAKKKLIETRLIEAELRKSGITFTASDEITNPFKVQEAVKAQTLTWRMVDYAFVFIDPTDIDYQSNKEKVTYSYNLLIEQLSLGKSMQASYNAVRNDPGFFQPITITLNRRAYKSTFDTPLSLEIFKFKKGQYTGIVTSGGTFIVADVTDSKDTPYTTLNQWLSAQQK